MDRFIVFRWDKRCETAHAQADRWMDALRCARAAWVEVTTAPGLRVIARPRNNGHLPVTRIAGTTGMLLGSVFERGKGAQGPRASLTARDVSAMLGSADVPASSSFWGSFVALLPDEQSGDLQIVRDACGATPCFRMRSSGVDLLFASVEDVAVLPGLRVSIDWMCLHAFLVHNYLISRRTGLQEIAEVLPGERLTIRPDGSAASTWTWSPARLASLPHKRRFSEARDELRETVDDCLAAWGKSYARIAVRMSGGLDSSIVASVLSRATSSHITGIHLVGQGYEAYELKLARLAAKHAGIELLELEMPPAARELASVLDAPRLVRPSPQLLGAPADKALTAACHALGCDSIMTGHGGDTLFLQRSIAADVLVDYLRLNPLAGHFWRRTYDAAVLLQAPVWRVLRRTGEGLFGGRKWSPTSILDNADAPFRRLGLSDSLERIPADYMHHDWLTEAAALPPCKAEQVRSMVALRNYHSHLSHGLEFAAVQPLISQPILDLCLRTPAYVFCEGGVDRALERAAFEPVLPPEIVRRFEKGFINHHLTHDLSGSSGNVRDFLLEGNIVAEGLVAPNVVKSLFDGAELLPAGSLAPIMSLLAAEVWVTSWRNNHQVPVT